MKEESEKTYTYYRKAQYHETDQMGIIHHSNYVKMDGRGQDWIYEPDGFQL